MGCLFAVFAGLFPRAADIILWIARPSYFSAAFGGSWFWPLLGLVFLPWTTLIYILVAAPVGGISFWGWLMVGLGVISDLTAHAQAYTNREQATALYQQSAT